MLLLYKALSFNKISPRVLLASIINDLTKVGSPNPLASSFPPAVPFFNMDTRSSALASRGRSFTGNALVRSGWSPIILTRDGRSEQHVSHLQLDWLRTMYAQSAYVSPRPKLKPRWRRCRWYCGCDTNCDGHDCVA